MTDTEARMIRTLTGGEMPRVWSLLVTVFGDLTLERAEGISGTTLNHITGAIGIKPEAVRVALHRLRKDGWIESERVGRQSLYRLSHHGRAQSEAARPRIYGPAPALADCRLILTPPGGPAPEGGAQVGAGSFLVVGDRDAADWLCLPLDRPLPGWMRERAVDPALCEASGQCEARFAEVAAALKDAPDLPPLTVAVLRVLIVHGWRRIALRAPWLPDEVLPVGWRGAPCRRLFAEMLDRLPKPGQAALETACQSRRAA